MSTRLKGKSIIVTGAARGIGAAMAMALAKEGARLVIADIDEDGAENFADQLKAHGHEARAVRVDIQDTEGVERMIALTVERYGKLDTIFNNAGIVQVRKFLEITPEDWRKVNDVNGLGTMLCMQAAIRQMLRQGSGGSVVNMASIGGKQGYEPFGHYCASKFAIISLTQTAARAFGDQGIRVNAICPGFVDTQMWVDIGQDYHRRGITRSDRQAFEENMSRAALGRNSKPEDLGGIACFLASDDSAFMTGQSVLVDGGVVFD